MASLGKTRKVTGINKAGWLDQRHGQSCLVAFLAKRTWFLTLFLTVEFYEEQQRDIWLSVELQGPSVSSVMHPMQSVLAHESSGLSEPL